MREIKNNDKGQQQTSEKAREKQREEVLDRGKQPENRYLEEKTQFKVKSLSAFL